jgi:hypothetical protein
VRRETPLAQGLQAADEQAGPATALQNKMTHRGDTGLHKTHPSSKTTAVHVGVHGVRRGDKPTLGGHWRTFKHGRGKGWQKRKVQEPNRSHQGSTGRQPKGRHPHRRTRRQQQPRGSSPTQAVPTPVYSHRPRPHPRLHLHVTTPTPTPTPTLTPTPTPPREKPLCLDNSRGEAAPCTQQLHEGLRDSAFAPCSRDRLRGHVCHRPQQLQR